MTGAPQVTKVTINTWLMKTFLKRNCEAYLAQLNLSALEKAREALLKVKEEKMFPEWRHYCGEKPWYWDVKIGDGAITFEGGLVWRAEIEGDELYTDGCTTRGLLLDVIDEGLRQARTLRCNNATR